MRTRMATAITAATGILLLTAQLPSASAAPSALSRVTASAGRAGLSVPDAARQAAAEAGDLTTA